MFAGGRFPYLQGKAASGCKYVLNLFVATQVRSHTPWLTATTQPYLCSLAFSILKNKLLLKVLAKFGNTTNL